MVIRFYNPDNRLRTNGMSMDKLSKYRTSRNFHEILNALAGYGLMTYLAFYALYTMLHIFVLPCYTLWVMDDHMNIYQGCFIFMYFILLGYIVYKLWVLLNYERIMWYVIPDLNNLDCTQEDVDNFKKYYKYIKHDRYQIEDTLSDIVGIDVATLIMLYLPDFISLYSEVH